MSKRIVLVPAIVAMLCILLSPSLMAQSKTDADRFFQEAQELQEKARSNEELNKAVDKYEEALSIYRKTSDEKGESRTLDHLGNVYSDWGQYDKALEYYEKSLEIARKIQDVAGEGATLAGLGKVYSGLGNQHRDRGQYSKAVEYYEKSLDIARKVGDVANERRILNNLGVVFWRCGQYDKAIEHYEKSLAISRYLGDRNGKREALNKLGHVCKDWGKYDKAEDYYQKALLISIELDGAAAAEKNFYMGLGDEYRALGQYDKVLEYYEKSLELCIRLGNVDYEGYSLLEIGVIYCRWGRYETASEYYEKALDKFRTQGDHWGEMLDLIDLGEVYAHLGEYARAMEHFERSRQLCLELKCGKPEGDILMNLGMAQAHRGDYPNALGNFEKGLARYQSIQHPVAWPKKLIGDLHLDRGDIGMAEPLLKEAGYPASLGRLQLVKSDYQRAKEHYEKLRQSAEMSRDADNLFTAYAGLGMAYEGTGDDKRAEEYFLKAINLTEDLRSNLPRSQRETFFDVRINGFRRTAPYDGLARVRVKMERPLEAFSDSEYAKSRIFAEAMSKWSRSTSSDIPLDALKQDQELNDQLVALKKKRQEAYERANQEIISVIEPQVQEMEQKFQAHRKMLREKYSLFAATKYPEPMALTQTALKDNEWVLAYHVTDPGTIIYLTRGKEMVKALFKPIPREKLDELILTFRKPLEIVSGGSLVDQLKSFDLVTGKRLSDLLLADILDSLPSNAPLIIVPDASLGLLPFEMLVLNDKGTIETDRDVPYISGAEFFGDRNLISYCESVTALSLSRIQARAKKLGSSLLVIADPVYNEKDERLAKPPKTKPPTGVFPELLRHLNLMGAENDMGGLKFQRVSSTGELAKSLSAIYGKDCDVYTGLDASKTNFLGKIGPQLNRYDKIVFATHGYFGKDLPGVMEPTMILTLVPPGTDGYLRMTEVMGLNMNADIVVLMGSGTGLGKQIPGEGNMSMGRAFQYAGARSVLTSLWFVSERTSVNMVKDFFRNLKEGKSKLEALALARAEIRKKGFDHPFFWAAFILVGETN